MHTNTSHRLGRSRKTSKWQNMIQHLGWIVSLSSGLQRIVSHAAWQLFAFKVANGWITGVKHAGNGWVPCMLIEAWRRINYWTQKLHNEWTSFRWALLNSSSWRRIRGRRARWEFDSRNRGPMGQTWPSVPGASYCRQEIRRTSRSHKDGTGIRRGRGAKGKQICGGEKRKKRQWLSVWLRLSARWLVVFFIPASHLA